MIFFSNRDSRVAAQGAIVFLAAFLRSAHAQDADYVVKARMVITFTQSDYVNWPEGAFPNASSPFIIGVLGDDAVAGIIESRVGKRTVGGRRITVRRARSPEELKGCQVAFIGKAESAHAASILGTANVLTVGDADNFTQQGGVIGFFIKDEKIHFHINSNAARRAGIDLTGRLLGAGE